MYTRFFSLKQAPFSIAPDPRYLFMTDSHREALAHLLYGIGGGGGLVLLTGEIGAGKTTVCRCFLEQVPPNCNVAYIFNPKLTVNELLQSICDEFHIKLERSDAAPASVKDYVDALTGYLLKTHAEGQNNVLVIDEAQNLSADVLEQLRLLTNLETSERKLLQIILIGQPELRTMLERPDLQQLAQRIIARYHLRPLTESETASYIQHRLAVAGLESAPPLQPKLAKYIHRLTKGVPRRINLLCDRALLGAYAEGKHVVERRIITKAAEEVFGREQYIRRREARPAQWRFATLGLAAGVLLAGAGATAWTLGGGQNSLLALWKTPATIAAPPQASSQAPTAKEPGNASAGSGGDAVAAKDNANANANANAQQPKPVAEPQPGLLSERDGKPLIALDNKNDLFRQLAGIWGVKLEEGDACEAALKQGMHCFASDSGLAGLRQLDRPAVLTLNDSKGTPYYAILTGLTDSAATLKYGDRTQSISLVVLSRYFTGNFATFWRAPGNQRTVIKPGDQGEDIDRVAAQLAKLSGEPAPAPNQPVDENMSRRIREFQAAQGLRVDGVIGPVTFMHLSRAAGLNEPRLRQAGAASSSGE
ncbi:MAG TPA: AAA family ATPase [Noviherbaspirillum sp.]|jgi:general secretion pathway protein A|uniref:ExeA family protein n=1 Tax=Noviherbaspirillum sp. TaxID=1926288 RepID=UPI002DDD5CE3|nr:AAA family ATPase [Noviherbaspirillum sp.]HEV2610654.1 AAA family ATPase [Noviherbaspirillum sp.]